MLNKTLRPKTDKDFGAAPLGYVAGRGRGATGFASGVSRDGAFKPVEEKEGDLGDGNYDEFCGYGGSLFTGGGFDAEDNEADQIYDLVDARMEGRRKKARQLREVEEIEEAKSALGFQKKFTEYRQDLSKVSEEEWMALPEAQERLKSKKVKREFLQAVPDRLIVGDSDFSINEVGVAKQAVLTLTLDKETTGSASIDPEGYLGEMEKSKIGDIAEIKKARLLFRSITRSDPTNATAWLALARLEEGANNVLEAKSVIASGIVHCSTSDDLWLCGVRLETNSTKAKSIIANGIRQNPQSAKLWIQAAQLEDDQENKRKVYQKAIEFIKPPNIQLWKGLINLSSGKETVLLLQRSVQACPHCEEFWLMLAKLSDEPQKILNDARRAISSSVAVWVAAAELASRTNPKSVEPILNKAIESLGKHGVVLSRKEWYVWANKSGDSLVAKLLVRVSLIPDLQQMLLSRSPKEVKHRIVFADWHEQEGNPIVREAILESTVFHVPELAERKGIWIRLITHSHSVELFEQSVSACPNASVLWLMYAKFLWSEQGDSEEARTVLERALSNVDDCEDLYLAMIKLVNRPDAMKWLEQGRSRCNDCERLWVKSAQLFREDRDVGNVVRIVNEGLSAIRSWKLYLIAVHAFLESGDLHAAREWSSRACEACPSETAVWLVAADIAVIEQDWGRGRSILERARMRSPQEENLWWKGLQIEIRSGSPGVNLFLSRGLQACPNSGLLWSWAVALEPSATRHPKCLDALKRCQSDPLVVGAVGMFFWQEKQQMDKARKWFDNALKLDDKFGQIWAYFFAFEISLGEDNIYNVLPLLTAILAVKEIPNKGIEWNEIVKRIENWNNTFLQNILVYIQEKFSNIVMTPKISQLVDESLNREVKSVKSEH